MARPLLVLDMDNTLLDRERAIESWAERMVEDFGSDLSLSRIVEEDQDGFRPRREFFTALALLVRHDEDEVHHHYLAHYPRSFDLDDDTRTLLNDLREHYVLAIVTNGPPFQADVIRHSGLQSLVDHWFVSELVDIRKPDPALVDLALEVSGTEDVAFVIGDSEADIGLAHNADTPSIWIDRGRGPITSLPTHVRPSFAECRDLLLP